MGLIAVGADRRYCVVNPDRVARQLDIYRVRFPDLMADAARDIFDNI
jgi:hypothetical protein